MSTPITCAASLQSMFHEQMPLTRAMGLTVERCDDQAVILTAPLELNHNHLGTAFGGSLIALATAAAYGMMWTVLGDSESHLVIQSSAMTYHKPVRHDLRAVCSKPSVEEVNEFILTFRSKGKARISCEVTLHDGDIHAATFKGTFVALH